MQITYSEIITISNSHWSASNEVIMVTIFHLLTCTIYMVYFMY